MKTRSTQVAHVRKPTNIRKLLNLLSVKDEHKKHAADKHTAEQLAKFFEANGKDNMAQMLRQDPGAISQVQATRLIHLGNQGRTDDVMNETQRMFYAPTSQVGEDDWDPETGERPFNAVFDPDVDFFSDGMKSYDDMYDAYAKQLMSKGADPATVHQQIVGTSTQPGMLGTRGEYQTRFGDLDHGKTGWGEFALGAAGKTLPIAGFVAPSADNDYAMAQRRMRLRGELERLRSGQGRSFGDKAWDIFSPDRNIQRGNILPGGSLNPVNLAFRTGSYLTGGPDFDEIKKLELANIQGRERAYTNRLIGKDIRRAYQDTGRVGEDYARSWARFNQGPSDASFGQGGLMGSELAARIRGYNEDLDLSKVDPNWDPNSVRDNFAWTTRQGPMTKRQSIEQEASRLQAQTPGMSRAEAMGRAEIDGLNPYQSSYSLANQAINPAQRPKSRQNFEYDMYTDYLGDIGDETKTYQRSHNRGQAYQLSVEDYAKLRSNIRRMAEAGMLSSADFDRISQLQDVQKLNSQQFQQVFGAKDMDQFRQQGLGAAKRQSFFDSGSRSTSSFNPVATMNAADKNRSFLSSPNPNTTNAAASRTSGLPGGQRKVSMEKKAEEPTNLGMYHRMGPVVQNWLRQSQRRRTNVNAPADIRQAWANNLHQNGRWNPAFAAPELTTARRWSMTNPLGVRNLFVSKNTDYENTAKKMYDSEAWKRMRAAYQQGFMNESQLARLAPTQDYRDRIGQRTFAQMAQTRRGNVIGRGWENFTNRVKNTDFTPTKRFDTPIGLQMEQAKPKAASLIEEWADAIS